MHEAERSFALSVVERLREAGFEALWAGGCVRDLIRGEQPSDYDVATSATPKQVRALFGHRKTIPVGISFGVVIVVAPLRREGQVEVATFRTDTSYSDGRRPDAVTFSTAKEDALRRDFTINGMFMDPLKDEVIDYVGGQEDLKSGVIRAIGNAQDRIAEDKLRMLRAVRFAARFGFAIEEATREAVRRSASEVSVVSGERISVELEKTLATNRAGWALAEWDAMGLMQAVLPEFSLGWADAHNETQALLEALVDTTWQVKMSGLLLRLVAQDGWERALQGLRTRLKWSNADTEEIRFGLTSQATLDQARTLSWSALQPVLINANIRAAMQLLAARHELDGKPEIHDWICERLAQPNEQLDPPPLVVGRDLIALGLRPGPKFKRMLDEIRVKQLDGELIDKPSAIQWAQAMAKSMQ